MFRPSSCGSQRRMGETLYPTWWGRGLPSAAISVRFRCSGGSTEPRPHGSWIRGRGCGSGVVGDAAKASLLGQSRPTPPSPAASLPCEPSLPRWECFVVLRLPGRPWTLSIVAALVMPRLSVQRTAAGASPPECAVAHRLSRNLPHPGTFSSPEADCIGSNRGLKL